MQDCIKHAIEAAINLRILLQTFQTQLQASLKPLAELVFCDLTPASQSRHEMFQVGRFDPRDEDRKKRRHKSKEKKKKRRKREERATTEDEKTTSLRVISTGDEAAAAVNDKRHSKTNEEAFDDLDIEADVDIDNETAEHSKAGEDGHENENDKSVSVNSDKSDEIKMALHMSSVPIRQAASAWKLAPFLVDNLENEGCEHFFPIQSLVIPDVITTEHHSHIQARDVCVAAPTGSGKTLAFVLPVLNSISNRKLRRLRALVVLPSRDLARQVFDVFEKYSVGSDLKIGLAVGQSDFRAEQLALTVDNYDVRSSVSEEVLSRLRQKLDSNDIDCALDNFALYGSSEASFQIPRGGVSAVDVLVCTPGRLVDHLDNTPGFTLQHLRYLVIDEADRLLSQSYHGWVGRVIDSAGLASKAAWQDLQKGTFINANDSSDISSIDPITWRRQEGPMDDSLSTSTFSTLLTSARVCQPVQLRKMLYSATMTKDPQKLAGLRLINPKFFDAHKLRSDSTAADGKKRQLYSMPPGLQEFTIECTAEQKPVALLALLLEQMEEDRQSKEKDEKQVIVIFTSSLESTHRLCRLLQLLWTRAEYGESDEVAEFSSALSQAERSLLVSRCNDPGDRLSVVVCSDGMSRGMDIDYVSTVINYDIPAFAKTYVHRCGRTARAGRKGNAFSLLKSGQVGHFFKVRRLIQDPNRVSKRGVKVGLVRNAVSQYKTCVARLKDILKAEDFGRLKPTDPRLDEFVALDDEGSVSDEDSGE